MTMKCPMPCVCGEIVELDEMRSIQGTLPDGGNLVCPECYCIACDGSGQCSECDGMGNCPHCGSTCNGCDGETFCCHCHGLGYDVQDTMRKGETCE